MYKGGVKYTDTISVLANLAVLRAPEGEVFTLKSGQTSSIYIDVRRAVLDSRGLLVIVRDLYGATMRWSPDKVAGVAVGGCPLATGVSLWSTCLSREGEPQYDALYVRPEVKAHGTGRKIEGVFQPGESVVLYEDVTTTGGSTIAALRALREAGLNPRAVVAVLDREAGAAEAIRAEGVDFKALCTMTGVTP